MNTKIWSFERRSTFQMSSGVPLNCKGQETSISWLVQSFINLIMAPLIKRNNLVATVFSSSRDPWPLYLFKNLTSISQRCFRTWKWSSLSVRSKKTSDQVLSKLLKIKTHLMKTWQIFRLAYKSKEKCTRKWELFKRKSSVTDSQEIIRQVRCITQKTMGE